MSFDEDPRVVPADPPRCLSCGERLAAGDERVTVRGAVVHRRCALYRPRAARRSRRAEIEVRRRRQAAE